MKAILLLASATLLGVASGVGVFTFGYARGASYLTNDPAACANCHIMQSHYDDWRHSSHRSVAACNDCHTPPGLVPKYATKASNGFWHSFAFTTGRFHEPLRIKPRNREVTERACRKCHAAIVEAIEPVVQHRPEDATPCTRCHATVGHMR
ncbi:MAG TPA: cytochrome c nitrite reductase small subunit [Thermoanaerobaculia bacterium]|nr:cytochrome c nitrite reductase small subunit [Thermoanaerobaculia bacterium]